MEFESENHKGKNKEFEQKILKKAKNNDNKFHFEINSFHKAIKEFQAAVYQLLPNSLSADIFAMALHEIVVNAAEHGNKMDQEKKVIIELCFDSQYLYAEVEDQGSGFDWRKIIKKSFELCSSSDRGRGIMMTVKGCDVFFYNKKGNKAYLLKLNNL